MRKAVETVDKILRTFPEYGKAPPSYVASLVEIVAYYPSLMALFADKVKGIPARCKFLPTIADFVAMATELTPPDDGTSARVADLAARVEQARLTAPEGDYHAKQIPRYYDKHRNEIRPGEAEERLEQFERDKASMARVQRMTSYVKELGNGDALAGWQIAIERGIQEPPENWNAPK